MSAVRPHDEAGWHALHYALGPYGRQDVHLHPCIACDPSCDRVLVGRGRDTCDGNAASHVPAHLDEVNAVRFPFGAKRGRREVRTWEGERA